MIFREMKVSKRPLIGRWMAMSAMTSPCLMLMTLTVIGLQVHRSEGSSTIAAHRNSRVLSR